MDDDEDISRNEVEEKKKPRRVSFSDITSIHFFDRDEDFETPPDNKPSIEASASPSNALNVLNTPPTMDQRDTPDKVREFFGPVSLWHIAPGSTAQSPITNDITLDCTEFSQQFSKLVGPRKNFTDVDNTPATETTEDSAGNSMTLTQVFQPDWQPVSAECTGQRENTGDMSLTGEKLSEYDFASISSDFVTPLADKELHVESKTSQVKKSPYSTTLLSKNNRVVDQAIDPKLKDPGNEICQKGDSLTADNTGCSIDSLNAARLPAFPPGSLLKKQCQMKLSDNQDGAIILSKEKDASDDRINWLENLRPENDSQEMSSSKCDLANEISSNTDVFNKKVTVASGNYIDQEVKKELKHRHESPMLCKDLMVGENTKGVEHAIAALALSKYSDPVALHKDSSSIDDHNSVEISVFLASPKGCHNHEISGKEQGGGIIETLQSHSHAAVFENDHNQRYNLEIPGDQQVAECDNSAGNTLKLKDNDTEENLRSIEQGTLLVIPGSVDKLFTNSEDHIPLFNTDVVLMKKKTMDHPINAELTNPDKGSAHHTDFGAEKKTNVACKLNDITGSIPSHSELLALAPTPPTSATYGNMSLVRPVLAPIALNLQDLTPLSILDESQISGRAYECNDLAAQKNNAKHGNASDGSFPTPAKLVSCADAGINFSFRKNAEHLNSHHRNCRNSVSTNLQEDMDTLYPVTPLDGKCKQTTKFIDISELNKQHNSSCKGKENQSCIKDPSLKESASWQTFAFFRARDDEGSVCKQSIAVKQNIELENRASMKEKEVISSHAQERLKTKEKVWPSSQQKASSCHETTRDWQNMERLQVLEDFANHMPQESMTMRQAIRDLNDKTSESIFISQTGFPLLQADCEGNYNKEMVNEESLLHKRDTLKNISVNDSLNNQSKLGESSITAGMSLKHIPNRSVHSVEKQSFSRWMLPAGDYLEMASRKPTEVTEHFYLGVQELSIASITKPSTLQECLHFIYVARPQVSLFQDTVKQLQKDIENMKILSNMQNQTSDGKKLLRAKNKPELPGHFRLGYIKWLQQMLAHGKSKSQLLQAKKTELMNRVQELRSACQEVDKLKAWALLDKRIPFKQRNDCLVMGVATSVERRAHIVSLEADIEKQIKSFANKKVQMEEKLQVSQKENQETCERVIIMKQELDVLDSKIKDLCEFYHGFCNVKGNVSREDIIESLENHVKKMTKNSVILQDMQLWKLKDIKSKPGEHLIELNYIGMMTQRFVIEGNGPSAKVSSSHSLDYKTVERVFPFTNASVAFHVVFALKKSFRIMEAGSIKQTIREMSFLLGTLLDVLEEIQLCRTGLQNLSFARFHSVHGDDSDLHLHLTFLDYASGLKVVVILDMNVLKCGVYPSDVLPRQVEIHQSGQSTESRLTVEEIQEAIQNVKTGYSRLRNLSVCVSKLIDCKK